MTRSVTPRVVEQRIRNRLIEFVDMIVDWESDHPPFDLNEALNQWEDCVGTEHPVPENLLASSVYSTAERRTIATLDAWWLKFCDATPQTIGDEAAAIATQEWLQFSRAAREAQKVFQFRGRLSEEIEQDL